MKEIEEFVGWDIGGAHLKQVRVDGAGQVVDARQFATPLWLGLDSLREHLQELRVSMAGNNRMHALTITGELADIFANRKQGVESLIADFSCAFADVPVYVYAGRAGLLETGEASRRYELIASANWHATATYLAMHVKNCVLLDMGSTTTDLIMIRDGQLANQGYTDQERMRKDELLYTGLTRTPVMAVVSRVPFAGQWQTVAAENFASMADVYRVSGELDEHQDLLPASDGGEKTVSASMQRLARMLGADYHALDESDHYLGLAQYIATKHLQSVARGLTRLLGRHPPVDQVHVVGAGTGRRIIEKLCRQQGYAYTDIENLIDTGKTHTAMAADCAAAVSVAQLARLMK